MLEPSICVYVGGSSILGNVGLDKLSLSSMGSYGPCEAQLCEVDGPRCLSHLCEGLFPEFPHEHGAGVEKY